MHNKAESLVTFDLENDTHDAACKGEEGQIVMNFFSLCKLISGFLLKRYFPLLNRHYLHPSLFAFLYLTIRK